jgi:Tfp pilus assembly protein PilV
VCIRRRVEGERGETLLELIIAIAILGVGVIAIVSGISVSIMATDTHRKQAIAGTTARSYAEFLENAAAQAGGYIDCAGVGTYPPYAPPTSFTASVTAVKYWNGSTFSAANPCANVGVQQLTIEVASSDKRAIETVVVVLRKPCGVGSTCS